MTAPHPETRDSMETVPVRLVIGSVATLLLLAALDQTVVSTALPTIVSDLGGIEHLSWVVTSYILASTVAAPLYGKLGDLYGRKRMVYVSVGLFLLGSLLCGIAGSMGFLILARAVQGLGGGGLFVLALSVIGDVIPPSERGKVQGMFAAVFSLSSMIGPLIGGWFVEAFSWHWIFLINLPLGLVAVVGFAASFPDRTSTRRHRIDWAGAATLSIALASLTLLTALGGQSFDWVSREAVVLAAATLLATALFIRVEGRAEEPLLPLSLFKGNVFRNTSVLGLLIGAAMLGAVTFLPLYLQVARGISPTVSGLLMAPMMIGIIAATTTAGRYMRRTARYRVLTIWGMALIAVGGAILAQLRGDTPIAVFVAMLMFYGFAMGLIFPVLTTAAQNAVARPLLGTATAAGVMFRQIGGSLAVAVFGAILAARLAGGAGGVAFAPEMGPQSLAALPPEARSAMADLLVSGLAPIYWIVAVLGLLGVVFALRLHDVPLARSEPGTQAG